MDTEGFELEPGVGGDVLVVTGPWSDRTSAVLASGRVRGLVLNYARGFQERSLEMLRSWPLERLDVLARTHTDLTPVYRLADTLRELSITTSPRAVLDCGRLPRLESLIASEWPQVRATVADAPRLTSLGLGGYDEPDLAALARLSGLRTLRLKQCRRLASLDPLGGEVALETLEISGARGLRDIAAVSGLTTLRRLWFRTCGGIGSLDAVSPLRRLDRLAVANCGPIESLAPVGELSTLTRLDLSESTRITDGDLRPLLRLRSLQDLRIMNRRHYVPPVAEVRAALGIG